MTDINKLLDRTKTEVFSKANSGFLGALMCSIEIGFDPDVPTARTDGTYINFNPTWFESLATSERLFVLLHELWHIARMHPIRIGSRKAKVWREACDYLINNTLIAEGFSMGSLDGLVDSKFKDMSEEEIYEILIKENDEDEDDDSSGDLQQPSQENQDKLIQTVSTAIHIAKQTHGKDTALAQSMKLLDKLTEPRVKWENVLNHLMTEAMDEDRSWSKPNRRYEDVYLPTNIVHDGKLKVINYYVDVSGSIDSKQIIRILSELKHIQEEYAPEELVLIQFDTRIQKIDRIYEDTNLASLDIVGRGGTCLVCVKEHIEKTKPTMSIIFTDLYCVPMEPIKNTDYVWIVYDNPTAKVNKGVMIHVSS